MDFLTLTEDDNNSLYTATIKDALEKRILIINQDIDSDIIEDYIYQIIRWNIEDKDIPSEKRQPIKLFINCNGGDCITGFSLVDVIKNSKTPVIGIGFGLVASMAYHIYISCGTRYAFADTILLMHDGEITISNSTSKARDTMAFFNNMEERTKKHVLAHTSITEEFYDKHYDQEFYMYADQQGKELGCVDYVIGIDCDLDTIL